MSVDIAEKIIRKNLDEKHEQMEMIDRMLDEVLAASKTINSQRNGYRNRFDALCESIDGICQEHGAEDTLYKEFVCSTVASGNIPICAWHWKPHPDDT